MAELTLIALRHCEAEPARHGAHGDHRRRLTERGQGQAEAMAPVVATWQPPPELALVSDAVRTQATWAAVRTAFDRQGSKPPHVRTEPKLYLSTIAAHAALVGAVATSEATCILVVGHNLALSAWISDLAAETIDLATGEAAVLTCTGESWAEALATVGDWTVRARLRP